MPVPEENRGFLEEMRSLEFDAHGREVLVGLSYDESEWYFRYKEATRIPSRGVDSSWITRSDRDRSIELHAKHELTRRQIIVAEAEARQVGSLH